MAQRVSRERLQKIAGGSGLRPAEPAGKGGMMMHKIKMGETLFEVTPEQRKAFNALPPTLRKNLKAPREGKVMTAEEFAELRDIGNKYSTVMCPW
jgi:hypothetical protein